MIKFIITLVSLILSISSLSHAQKMGDKAFLIDISSSVDRTAYDEFEKYIIEKIEKHERGSIYIIPIANQLKETCQYDFPRKPRPPIDEKKIEEWRSGKDKIKCELKDFLIKLKPQWGTPGTDIKGPLNQAYLRMKDCDYDKTIFILSDFDDNIDAPILKEVNLKGFKIELIFGAPDYCKKRGDCVIRAYEEAQKRWEKVFKDLGADKVNMNMVR